MSELPSSAKVIIVGGGIVGCSVAYHLGKMGLADVLLLERGKLTSGSTWHAAGLVGQLRTTTNLSKKRASPRAGSAMAAYGSPAIKNVGPRSSGRRAVGRHCASSPW